MLPVENIDTYSSIETDFVGDGFENSDTETMKINVLSLDMLLSIASLLRSFISLFLLNFLSQMKLRKYDRKGYPSSWDTFQLSITGMLFYKQSSDCIYSGIIRDDMH